MPEMTEEQAKEHFIDLMTGPDAAKVWRQRSIEYGAENDRLREHIKRLEQRIHNQRRSLRMNWETIEQRAQYKRAWYPSDLLRSLLGRVKP